jgi:O-antigen ligase
MAIRTVPVPQAAVPSRERRRRRGFSAAVLRTVKLSPGEISQAARFSVVLLVGAALILLQIAIGGNRLLSALPAYGLFALSALIVVALRRPIGKPDRIALLTAILFALYVAGRAALSPAPYFARADLFAVLGALILYLLTATVLSNPARRIAVLTLLFGFAICHVVIGLIQFGHGENFTVLPFLEKLIVTQRAGGFYDNPDHLAGLLEILGILALSLTCWSRRPKWLRVIYGYLALMCYIGVTLTASRGGYLSVVASLVVFGVLSLLILRVGGAAMVRKYGAIGIFILIGAFITPILLLKQDPILNKRVSDVASPDKTRLDLWSAAIHQWKLRPIVGTGSGTYRFYGRTFRANEMQADPVEVHNDYLHLLCEYGIVGLALFLLFLVAHVRYGWKSFRRLGPLRGDADVAVRSDRLALTIGALSAVGAYVIHSLVDFNMHIAPNAMLMAFVFGLLVDPGQRIESGPSVAVWKPVHRIAFAVLAVGLLFQCVRLFPGEYLAEQSRLALEDEHPELAIDMGRRALRYDQNNPNVFFRIGRGLVSLADQEPVHGKMQEEAEASLYADALAQFDAARHLAPLEEAYPLDMAFVFDQTNRFTEAEWMFSIARELDPHSVAVAALYRTHLAQWKKSALNLD